MKNLIIILFLFVSAYQVRAQSEIPFTYVENMPGFPGGHEAMYKFISDNIVYPDSCRSVKTVTHVIVQFVVDTAGYLLNQKVVRGYPCGFNDESLRIVSLMNEMGKRWSPGSHNGRKVPVTFTLPIKFVPAKD